MLDHELLQKMLREEPLTASEEAQIDQMLVGSASVGDLVTSLPDEVVSMAWRSELNSKLLALAPVVQTRTRLAWWKVAAPVAVAGAMAFSWLSFRSPNGIEAGAVSVPRTTEATLARAHMETTAQFDLTGGASVSFVGADQEPTPELSEWNPSDLESL